MVYFVKSKINTFNVVKAEYPTEEESTEEPAAKEYHCLNYHADIPSDAGSRSIAPSGVKGKSDDVSVVYRSNQYIKLNSGKLHGRSYSEVGDCIHNVYAHLLITWPNKAFRQAFPAFRERDVACQANIPP